ncbi:hypothetical protein VM98_33610, partial [Streptomyces rubellomurinus subsp. indigoferus]
VSALGEFGKPGEFGEPGKPGEFGEEGVAVGAQAVPLLGAPDAEVRRQAVSAFCSWGAGVVPLLRAARRGRSGPTRAGTWSRRFMQTGPSIYADSRAVSSATPPISGKASSAPSRVAPGPPSRTARSSGTTPAPHEQNADT